MVTQRTAALLDTKETARRAAPLAEKYVRLSAGQIRSEDTALSALRTRKAQLASLGEAYTSADTRVAVDRVRVEAGHATVQATETTTLAYKKIRGDEPATTGFQAHHRLSFADTADGKWQLTGLTSTDDGPLAVNEPATAPVAAARTTALPDATPAAISVPSRQQTKPAGSYNYAAMASYAEKHWQNYNPAYRKFNEAGDDSTNCVSQALKASRREPWTRPATPGRRAGGTTAPHHVDVLGGANLAAGHAAPTGRPPGDRHGRGDFRSGPGEHGAAAPSGPPAMELRRRPAAARPGPRGRGPHRAEGRDGGRHPAAQ
ncbi:hypothetical protein SANTM175S_04560 [Streptomyces antimycoticus]